MPTAFSEQLRALNEKASGTTTASLQALQLHMNESGADENTSQDISITSGGDIEFPATDNPRFAVVLSARTGVAMLVLQSLATNDQIRTLQGDAYQNLLASLTKHVYAEQQQALENAQQQ